MAASVTPGRALRYAGGSARGLLHQPLGHYRNWRELKPGIGTEAWFCDPQAPWQKGTVENLNKRARRYLPRDTQLAALSNRNMKAICDRLNGTPRKCLGWRTPTEAFREEMMNLR